MAMHGKSWTSNEDEQLRREYFAGTPLRTMMISHGRSVSGVSLRLKKLGLVDDCNNIPGYIALKQGHSQINPDISGHVISNDLFLVSMLKNITELQRAHVDVADDLELIKMSIVKQLCG